MRQLYVMVVAALIANTAPASAAIVLPQDSILAARSAGFVGPSNSYLLRSDGAMSSLVFFDAVPPRSNAAYLAQRSRTWVQYRNSGDPYRRFGMVYTPAAGSAMMDISDRQALVREHISRASAYRLRYFDK